MASCQVAYNSSVTVSEYIPETGTGLATSQASRTVTHNAFDTVTTLTTGGSPDVTTVVSFNKAMSGGAATIDLTSLTGTNGATISASGLKLRILKAIAKSTNANVVTISDGASNGYTWCGSSWSLALKPGAQVLLYDSGQGDAVSGSVKTIDLAGTLAQSVDFIMVFG